MTERKRVRFHPEAASEATVAFLWYRERSPLAAKRFMEELRTTVRLIADHPEAWPQYEEETRRIKMRAYPFLVIYRELVDRIEVLAVSHSRRRPGYWKGR